MRRCVLVALTIISALIALADHTPALGQQAVQPTRRRIVGGEKTDIAQHPWQAALIISGPAGPSPCGGTIVGRKWVLTAAHCFNDTSRPQDVRVKAGATDYRAGGGWDEVDRVIVHEGYNRATAEHDLALVRLKRPPNGRIIPLADPSVPLHAGELLEVTGWGVTSEGGEESPVLRKATVPYVESQVCNEPASYNGRIGAGMLCAGHREGGVDACQGDSGGPIVARRPEGAVLVGVVSFGEGCARKLRYGVYTRVTAYRAWLHAVVSTDKD